jgi:hypothetical protein
MPKKFIYSLHMTIFTRMCASTGLSLVPQFLNFFFKKLGKFAAAETRCEATDVPFRAMLIATY